MTPCGRDVDKCEPQAEGACAPAKLSGTMDRWVMRLWKVGCPDPACLTEDVTLHRFRGNFQVP